MKQISVAFEKYKDSILNTENLLCDKYALTYVKTIEEEVVLRPNKKYVFDIQRNVCCIFNNFRIKGEVEPEHIKESLLETGGQVMDRFNYLFYNYINRDDKTLEIPIDYLVNINYHDHKITISTNEGDFSNSVKFCYDVYRNKNISSDLNDLSVYSCIINQMQYSGRENIISGITRLRLVYNNFVEYFVIRLPHKNFKTQIFIENECILDVKMMKSISTIVYKDYTLIVYKLNKLLNFNSINKFHVVLINLDEHIEGQYVDVCAINKNLVVIKKGMAGIISS